MGLARYEYVVTQNCDVNLLKYSRIYIQGEGYEGTGVRWARTSDSKEETVALAAVASS